MEPQNTAQMLSPARQDALRQAAQKNADRDRPPFSDVLIASRTEVMWIYREWRWSGEPTLPATMVRPDFRGVRFTNADLSYLQLCEADLRDADCTGAKLVNASLMRAQVQRAILNNCIGTAANFEHADLTGAFAEQGIFNEADFSYATLCQATFSGANLASATLIGIDGRAARFDQSTIFRAANLTKASLRDADCTDAIFSNADLHQANLNGTNLTHAKLDGASLIGARLSAETDLTDAVITKPPVATNAEPGLPEREICLQDVEWNGVALTRLTLPDRFILGDEAHIARAPNRIKRIHALENAAGAYRGLGVALRSQGLLALASAARFREQQLKRRATFARRHYLEGIGLALVEFVSGHGERLSQTIRVYLGVILGFALGYFLLSPPYGSAQFLDALITSFAAFHGRGLFPGLGMAKPHDLPVIIGAIEGITGLFVELNLIATFTRRFLGN